jgi:aconitate hydratase
VLAVSFERIHRSNLVGMGVLPLQFADGESAATYQLDGSETFSIDGIAAIEPRQDVTVKVTREGGETFDIIARCRIDTYNELEYYRSGGILQYVLRNLAS